MCEDPYGSSARPLAWSLFGIFFPTFVVLLVWWFARRFYLNPSWNRRFFYKLVLFVTFNVGINAGVYLLFSFVCFLFKANDNPIGFGFEFFFWFGSAVAVNAGFFGLMKDFERQARRRNRQEQARDRLQQEEAEALGMHRIPQDLPTTGSQHPIELGATNTPMRNNEDSYEPSPSRSPPRSPTLHSRMNQHTVETPEQMLSSEGDDDMPPPYIESDPQHTVEVSPDV